MAFTRDGKVLAVAWSRHLVRPVNASNGQELATLTIPDPQRITKLCFSPDEDQLAVATENYVIHLWDLRGLRAQLVELGLDWDSPPDPSCPPWFDPAEWASPKRIGRCLEQRMKCELWPGEYLPDLTEEDRTYVDRLAEVVTAFAGGR
jgi:hypothetical protein